MEGGNRNKKQVAQKDAGFGGMSNTQGLVIEPHVAIVISLVYVGIVIVLHMIGKYRKDSTVGAV